MAVPGLGRRRAQDRGVPRHGARDPAQRRTDLGAGPDGFGVYHEAACTLASEADLLLHDAQYLPDEWPRRAHYGHSTVSYAVGLAEAAHVRTLLLFHHDPARTDAEITELTTHGQHGAAVDVQAAADGQTFDLGHDER